MNKESRKDGVITAILTAIWFGAVAVIINTHDDMPVYLLGIGTLFFLMLVPSMKELVGSVENFVAGNRRDGLSTGDD